ncbi:MAG: 4Fe-4S dicluster domain-containing protein [SAR324 cluster bacterium]|nr:4Fe-4S dicluster domain-containing protein [SAR324 cluster bacterium]
MAKYAMVIDLHNCVGCAACDIACKTENNTDAGFNWSSHVTETRGTFPNVSFRYIPTLCNHCENAPCVKVCPTEAMYKDNEGFTLHDADKCIGCRSCELACPYKVIHFNKKQQHQRYMDDKPLIPGVTSSGKETADKTGVPLPYYNPDRAKTYDGIRREGIVEKCTFCDHRVKEGLQPWCVEACPGDARIFGDTDDPTSRVSQLLKHYTPRQLLKHKGTKPRVFYIRDYGAY